MGFASLTKHSTSVYAAPANQTSVRYNGCQTVRRKGNTVTDTPYPSLTSDDEQARRLCALAIAFSNAKSPISSDEVHAAHYQDLSDDSFRRKFSRDRIKLVECGLVIRQVGITERDALWQADEHSFADGSTLSADDALMLDVLCTQLVADPSFAYRNELRLALAKIDHAFGTLTAARLDPAQHSHGPLQVMLACMEQGHLASITYVDARGNTTERIVAPYGHFGLRGNLYFVCAQAGKTGVDSQSLRTFRIDRVAKARQEKGRFAIPEDFCVDDHMLLPFQLGLTTCTAQLMPGPSADADMLAELDRRADVLADGARSVGVSDVVAAARWAIAADMKPIAPAELADAWQHILQEASVAQAVPQPKDYEPLSQRTMPGQRGRKGGSDTMRELMVLVSSLGTEGATLTPASVAARLGVSVERATLLINLILTACTDTDYQLPLALADDNGVVLSRSQGVTGRPIRLTTAEAQALVAALDELGFAPEDPLRVDVLEAFAPTSLSEADVTAHIEAALTQDQNETLEACSRAISAGAALTFSYQAMGQAHPAPRRVAPQAIRHVDEFWYLDTFDYGRRAQRTFRIDRMADVHIARVLEDEPVPDAPTQRQERMVGITFSGHTMLDLLEWPRLEVLGTRGKAIVTQLPFYGGMWLPRHLAACGSLATTSDDELASLARGYGKSIGDLP